MASPITYPHWKQHSIGNFYQLDEEVDIDTFREETNFNGLAYYDPTTRLVKYYSTSSHYLELSRYEATANLQCAILDYFDNDYIYCTSVFFYD